MRVSIETTSGLERKVTVAVPSESFEEQIEKRLRSTAREAQLPGFRRGKVPVKEIRRRFGTSLRQEVAVELVESSYNDMVNQENLNPAGQPAIELVNIEADADLEFVATVEVLPEVELADFHTLRIGQPEAAIAASDVDAMVQNLREQRVAWTAVERPAAAQDRVRVDYTVQVDGKAIDDRAREDVQFVVGRGEAFEELDAAVAGMAVDETRAFPVAISEEHPDTELRGREAIGEVTLKAVDEPILPELDDAFFDDFDVGEAQDGGSRLAMFRDDVRERMQAELDAAARRVTRREVMSALYRIHDFEVPKTLVEAEAERESRGPEDAEELPDDMREIIADITERRVRVQLVVREIVAQQSMEADAERVEERIEEIVGAYESPREMRNWIYADETQLERIEAAVLEEQVMDYVLEQAQVVPVSMSYKDVVAGRPLPELPPPEEPEALPPQDAEAHDAVPAVAEAAATEPAAEGPPPSAPEPLPAEPQAEPAMSEAEDAAAEADGAGRGLLRRLFGRNRS